LRTTKPTAKLMQKVANMHKLDSILRGCKSHQLS
jgi:hypothetical protein